MLSTIIYGIAMHDNMEKHMFLSEEVMYDWSWYCLQNSIYLVLGYADFIGQILSVLVLIALAIPLKGSTRSCLYAAGSVISFFIGGFIAVVMFMQHPPSPYVIIEWHNVLGVVCGYLLLGLAIFQYRIDSRNHESSIPLQNSGLSP